VLVVVILDRDREADGGVAGVQQLGVVAAAAEAVVAPDLANVEAEAHPGRQFGEEAGEVARGESFSPPRLRWRAARSSLPCQRGPSEKTRTLDGSQTPSSRSCFR
jgi:hypothetical protein